MRADRVADGRRADRDRRAVYPVIIQRRAKAAPAAVLGAMLLLASCRREEPRPAGLPTTAVYVGTPKHWDYIDCSAIPVAAGFDCTVFNAAGTRVAVGYFAPASGASFNPRDPREYLAFDGSHIVLTGGRRLEVCEPPRPAGVPTTATWSGGPVCGTFAECSALPDRAFYCRVFQERTGAVLAAGRYQPRGAASGSLRAPCAGDRITFSDGDGYLERTP